MRKVGLLVLAATVLTGGCERTERTEYHLPPPPPEGLFESGDVQCFDGTSWYRGFRIRDGGDADIQTCIANFDNSEGWTLSRPPLVDAQHVDCACLGATCSCTGGTVVSSTIAPTP